MALVNSFIGGTKPTGNASEEDVLLGKTFSNESGTGKTGTMPNQGAKTSTLTTNGSSYTIPAGYHNGSGKVTANITNLTAGNIKTGISVGGVTGTFKGLGNATAAQVLAGKTFSTASLSNATGTMVDNSGKTSTSSYVAGTFRSGTTGYVFASPTAGYCSANTYIRVPVTNLSAGNIKKGVNIGGVAGTYNPTDEIGELSKLTYTVTVESQYRDNIVYIVYDNRDDGASDGGNIYLSGVHAFNSVIRVRTVNGEAFTGNYRYFPRMSSGCCMEVSGLSGELPYTFVIDVYQFYNN